MKEGNIGDGVLRTKQGHKKGIITKKQKQET